MGSKGGQNQKNPPPPLLGYEARVRNDEGGSVTLDLEAVPVSVKNVKLEGICRTKNDYVERAIGDVFSARSFGELLMKVAEAQETLRSLEAFSEVGTKVDTYKGLDAASDEYEITFLLKESSHIRGKVHTDVGPSEASAKAGLTLTNILGRGEKVGVDYMVSSVSDKRSELVLSKPFPYSRSSLSTTISYGKTSNGWSGFDNKTLGKVVDYHVKLKNRDSLNFQIIGVWRHLTATDCGTSFPVRQQCGHSYKSSARVQYSSEKRDDMVFPTTGIALRLCGEVAGLLGIGDAHFVKTEAEIQENISLLLPNLVAQFSLRGGCILPLTSSTAACNIADYFFLGGDHSLRGFQMRGVGPRQGKNSLGGKAYWAAAMHLYSPLPFSKKFAFADKVRLHAFLNAGSLTDSVGDEEFRMPRVAYGLGLAFRLGNIGRAELNYSFPLKYNSKTDLPRCGLAFGFGTDFL